MRDDTDTATHDIFDPRVLARRSDPSTSHQAAARVGEFAHSQHAKIYAALLAHADGLTAHEIAEKSGISAHAVLKRMHEMEAKGSVFVERRKTTFGTWIEVTRPTPSGRQARVWKPAVGRQQ